MNISRRKRVIKDLLFIVLAALVVATLKNSGDGISVFITDVIGTFFVTLAIMFVVRSICRETIREEVSLVIEEHLNKHTTDSSKK